ERPARRRWADGLGGSGAAHLRVHREPTGGRRGGERGAVERLAPQRRPAGAGQLAGPGQPQATEEAGDPGSGRGDHRTPGRPGEHVGHRPAGDRVPLPATTLPHDVTAEKVREVLADHPEVNGVVLVDSRNRPQWTIDRNRFLLAVTGPYGHALHAHRPASRL